jgi:hypothetical protein
MQPSITTTNINNTITYAGVNITIQQAQQAQRFIDDTRSGSDGVVRLSVQETNKTTVPVNIVYASIARLILPGGKVVNPAYVTGNVGLKPGATQASSIDFPVPTGTGVNRLILRLGAANEEQMKLPLQAGANVSQYAPHTTKLNGQLSYLGLNYSLVSATTQLSIDGQQAGKGLHYVIIALRIDSALAQTAIPGSPYDYVRLRTGKGTLSPIDATLPVSIAAGATGRTGTVTFLVPQSSTALTLLMLSQPQGGFEQASIDFQI